MAFPSNSSEGIHQALDVVKVANQIGRLWIYRRRAHGFGFPAKSRRRIFFLPPLYLNVLQSPVLRLVKAKKRMLILRNSFFFSDFF